MTFVSRPEASSIPVETRIGGSFSNDEHEKIMKSSSLI